MHGAIMPAPVAPLRKLPHIATRQLVSPPDMYVGQRVPMQFKRPQHVSLHTLWFATMRHISLCEHTHCLHAGETVV
jgi:hypothetical protein